jgi:hypothetical protein
MATVENETVGLHGPDPHDFKLHVRRSDTHLWTSEKRKDQDF